MWSFSYCDHFSKISVAYIGFLQSANKRVCYHLVKTFSYFWSHSDHINGHILYIIFKTFSKKYCNKEIIINSLSYRFSTCRCRSMDSSEMTEPQVRETRSRPESRQPRSRRTGTRPDPPMTETCFESEAIFESRRNTLFGNHFVRICFP